MTLVDFVVALALLQYLVFAMAVGRARGKYGVLAPAVSGHPDFERYLRVQQNTLECLIIVVPSLWLFARYLSEPWAAGLGAVYLIGRMMYFVGYTKAAAKRAAGYGVTALAMMALLLGALAGIVLQLLRG
ncbi:MAG TPA: MAPEG family protein [Steroidobacteraceae bacterium]|nr:MAPEG family protein [Steroidobacteraceae bacterium]HRX88895.1 MAPEG family protein [Steroidobacteraceae bacterium]